MPGFQSHVFGMHNIITGSLKTGCYKGVCSAQAGCIREAQSWEQMIKSLKRTNKEAAWSRETGLFQEILKKCILAR